jgi:cold shock CspA family protein
MNTLNRERGRNPNLGFGMVPPKPLTRERYLRAAKEVYDFLFGAVPNDEVLASISEVKGLCNRVLREDQPDWVIVWLRLGLPNKRRLKWIVKGLPALRQAVKSDDKELYSNISEMLLRAGLGTALKFFIEGEELPVEQGRGYLYLLSTRSDRNLLKIGQTQRNVPRRVEEINRATGVVEPLSPRRIWYVHDPVGCERAVHEVLRGYRVRVDREFFRVSLDIASKKITDLLRSTSFEVRQHGKVSNVIADKGFGFIRADNSDYFFHFSEVRGAEPADLKVGDDVVFDRLDTRFGLAAADVQRAV